MKKQNYVNNKDMLKEIHKSKLSYCYMLDEEMGNYDVIVHDPQHMFNDETIQQAKENRAAMQSQKLYEAAMTEWEAAGKKSRDKPKQADHRVDPQSIDTDDLIFRLMTYDHIPEAPGRKKNPKTEADRREKCNFPPFKHFKKIDGEIREVVRSHWEGGLDNGWFSTKHGSISNNLAKMFIKLCERYSMKGNWRNYTYIDEMRSDALLHLSVIGLKFDESKSQNPFAYFTAAVNNSFTRILNLEKRNQNIRDDLLQDAGHMPSYNRQLEHEALERAKWDESAHKEHRDAGFNL